MTQNQPEQEVQQNPLDVLVSLCQTLAAMEDAAEEMKELLAQKEQQIKDLSTRQIPDLMTSIGLTELRLTDGRKIAVKPDILASVSKERMPAVLAWLHLHNAQAIAKEFVQVETQGVDPVIVQGLQDLLDRQGVRFKRDATIHPSTLRAFVKEQLEQGTPDFPRELFGVHEGSKAVITTGR